MSEKKVFNDSIHGCIELGPELVKIIDTPQFQRLRNLKQLGGAYYVYPGASHNRFEHSIGVCHLAGKFARSLQQRQPELNITEEDVLCVEIAGLCHDLGHGAFSHLFDTFFIPAYLITQKDLQDERIAKMKGWTHEKASTEMFDHIIESNHLQFEKLKRKDLIFIKELIDGPDCVEEWRCEGRKQDKSFLYEIVSNKRNGIDVDKWDYFARDCHHLGIGNNFQLDRLILFSQVIEKDGQKQICFRDKEEKNIYGMFHTRYTLHDRAYQHITAKLIEVMITDAFLKANDELKFKGKNDCALTLAQTVTDMEAYTQVTDFVFQEILNSTSTSKELKESREILNRILCRKLYKNIGYYKLDKDKMLEKEEIKKMQDEMKQQIAEDCQISAESLGTFVRKLDFGMKDQNPLNKVLFFSKCNTKTAFTMTEDKVSGMLPSVFMEQSIHLYSKKSKADIEEIQKSFEKWCEKKRKRKSPESPSQKGKKLKK